MNGRMLKLAICAAMAISTGAQATDEQPETRPATLRTEQFENNELKMGTVCSGQLEDFLRDLNRRRDYDYSQHDEQPGPNNEYLSRWIHCVIDELKRRGYYFDSEGELHRPGPIVPTR